MSLTSMIEMPDIQQPAYISLPQRMRMVQAVLGALRMRRIAAGDVLSLHPPARHFHRLGRIADVVDDQDVADEAFHLGRDIGVVLVDIETMHALAVGLHEAS